MSQGMLVPVTTAGERMLQPLGAVMTSSNYIKRLSDPRQQQKKTPENSTSKSPWLFGPRGDAAPSFSPWTQLMLPRRAHDGFEGFPKDARAPILGQASIAGRAPGTPGGLR